MPNDADRTDRQGPLPLQVTPPSPPARPASAPTPAAAPPAAPSPGRDPSLDALVDMPNRVGAGFTVTLFVHGLAVTGELISERQFFAEQEALVARLLQTQHVDLGPTEASDPQSASQARHAAAAPQGGRRKEDAPAEQGEPEFVHLRSARLAGGDSASVRLWRGRVSAVDGYAILGPGSNAPASATHD